MVYSIIDKLVYGSLSYPHEHMRLFATFGNYANNFHFISQYSGNHLLSSLVTVMSLTIIAYRLIPDAMGVSTFWSFYYGLKAHHTTIDHWLYWGFSGIMIIPWTHLDRTLSKRLHVKIWPWSENFTTIAIVAHALFALMGVVTRKHFM